MLGRIFGPSKICKNLGNQYFCDVTKNTENITLEVLIACYRCHPTKTWRLQIFWNTLCYKKGNLDVPYCNINRVCFYHWLHTLEPTQRTVHARQTLIPLQRLCGFLPSRERARLQMEWKKRPSLAGVEGQGCEIDWICSIWCRATASHVEAGAGNSERFLMRKK